MYYRIIIIIIIGCGLIFYFFSKNDEKIITYEPVSIKLKINKKLFSKDFMVEVISTDPKVYYLHNFLKDNEADELINTININKKDSKLEVSSSNTVVTTLKKKLRNSSSAYIKKGTYINIEERAANFANTNIDKIEALNGIVYRKGEYFKEHMDTFHVGSEYLKNGGNRIGSIFCFLNSLKNEDGGCTHFLRLKYRIKPEKGNAVYFENMKDGLPDQRLSHEGESILTDTLKYGLNIWIREKEYVD